MRLFILLVTTIYSAAYAIDQSPVITHLFSVEAPTAASESYELLSTEDARVYKLAAENTLAVAAAKLASSSGALVSLTLTYKGGSEMVDSVEILAPALPADAQERKLAPENFRPTVLDSLQDAKKLFSSVYSYSSGYDVDDNCFNRAHYWARSFYVQNKIKSQKVFVLFTGSYRKKHDFKWWYHVAPFVMIDSGNGDEEWVLDPTFVEKPMKTHPWSLEFAEKASQCYVGKSLTDFRNQDSAEDCVLLKASMYHYTPNDLERPGSVSDWRCSDLKRVMKDIPAPYKKKWSDVKGFLPAECE